MKKLYFFIVAMLVSFAANAGLYMSGNFNGWSHCNPTYEFKETSTAGVYTVTVEKLYGEFLICSGTPGSPNWSDLRFGSNGKKVQEGVLYEAVKNGSQNFSMTGTVDNATVTLDTNKSTILVEGAAQQNSFTVVYLIGDIDGSGWDETTTGYPLESKGNDTYVGEISISQLSYVKPRCGNQILSAAGEDLVPVMGETYSLGEGDKAIALKAGTYTVTVVVNQAAETGTIKFTTDEPIVETIKFMSDVTGLVGVSAYRLENGSYTFDVEQTLYFTFTSGVLWDGAWRPAGGADEVLTDNGTVQAAITGEGCFVIETPGTYTVTPDAASTSFTISGFTGEVTYPATLYIIGYVDMQDFSVLNGPACTTAADGVYTWEGVTLGDAGAGLGYINIASVVDTEGTGDWDATVNSGNRYGAPTADAPLAVGAPADVKVYRPGIDASACQSWAFEPGEYDVTLDLTTMKISLAKAASGIQSVEADAVAPVYYNLQGVRVLNPENGMFIEVRGNKAVKVVK